MSNEKYWMSNYLFTLCRMTDTEFADHLGLNENDILREFAWQGKNQLKKVWYVDICKNQKEKMIK